MSSMIAQAVAAITAALQSAPAVAANVGRTTLRPIAQAAATAVIVRPMGAEAGYSGELATGPTTWTATIAIDCYARSHGATAPDESVDALLEATYARIMTDQTLGGAVLAAYPQQISYDFDADGEKTACVTLVLTTLHAASNGTLS